MTTLLLFLLIALGAGLALTAYLTEAIGYGYGAVGAALAGVSLVAMVFWRERRERRQETAADQAERNVPDSPCSNEENTVTLDNGDTIGVDEPQAERRRPAPTEDKPVPISVPDTGPDIVRVIPGRKRFHQPGCSLLTGHGTEELMREEAEEEGFTPCSVCCSNPKKIRKAV